MERVTHTFEPCFDGDCRILILGTMPSPKSREQGFYYGHPQNIFWKTLAKVLAQEEPAPTPEARRHFALKNHIALWDVLDSCEIEGADDNSIQNEVPNHLQKILKETKELVCVFTTGKKAKALYEKYKEEMYRDTGKEPMDAFYLPSTSPANRAFQKKERYWELWEQVKVALEKEPEMREA